MPARGSQTMARFTARFDSTRNYFEQRWLARLEAIGERKLQNMDRILKHPEYRSAFDCQIDMPGLAGGMMLGTVHQMYAMKCDEVRSSCFSV
jgi:hypothetical protein